MTAPEVSVVMAVRDGGAQLGATLASVLSQDGVNLELVVVDDGSGDGTAALLAEAAARDGRVRVLSQPNRGLTRSLIRGCAAARAGLIARQDAGDLSLPGRLRAQRDLLEADPGLALVGCRWELVGPGGEPLTVFAGEDRATASACLRAADEKALRNPHHGSVMFRRDVYERVGGYREAFAVGQDLDLWVRMSRCGDLAYVPALLYRARYALEGISARRAAEQKAVRRLIAASAAAVARGESDAAVIGRVEALFGAARRGADGGGAARARAAYFVAACLRRNRDPRAAGYYREALQANPLHVKALAGLVLSGLAAGRGAPR